MVAMKKEASSPSQSARTKYVFGLSHAQVRVEARRWTLSATIAFVDLDIPELLVFDMGRGPTLIKNSTLIYQ